MDLLSFNNIQIGRQFWMTENLNVETFKNGDSILEAKTDEQWKKANFKGIPAWCYYDNDPLIGKKYGKLYNWYAVTDPRGLAPEGWHIPKIDEWDRLVDFLGWQNAGSIMKSKLSWESKDNGNNELGFSALPGGIRSTSGSFLLKGTQGTWWSISCDEDYDGGIWCVFLSKDGDCLGRGDCSIEGGFSIRCVKD
jgi:uncharacterized protein (TIGR02145 family)